MQVAGLTGIDAIAAGHRHFLALDTDTGDLYAWGHNGSGQVGNGGLLDVTIPVVVLTGVASMSAGDGFSLAVKNDGTLWAWGRNTHGQLGLGDTADRLTPTQVPGITTADAVAAGGQHSLILLTDGHGARHRQQRLRPTRTRHHHLDLHAHRGARTQRRSPQSSAGYFHSAALGPGSQVSVWGRNFEGQCGGGGSSPVTYTSPQVARRACPARRPASTAATTSPLVELADGSFAGTGSNSDGQLDGSSVADQDDSQKILAPQVVPDLSRSQPAIARTR